MSPNVPAAIVGCPLRPREVTTIPLGRRSGVEAELPINGFYAAPGMEITFDASASSGTVTNYEWDLDGDGTYDRSTTAPVLKHTYAQEFDGAMILRVTGVLGDSNTLKTPVHISNTPAHQQLASPVNIKAEVISTSGGISEVRVTWESDDPNADSWGVAINGIPIARFEKAARSAKITDIQRGDDVLFQVFGITKDGAAGDRDGTTLSAAG